MNIRTRIALALLLAQAAWAQVGGGGGYSGPGVLSRGAQSVGNRAGQQINLGYSIGVSGVYETGLVPFSLDSTGKVRNLGGQPGVEASVAAFGTHEWRRAVLGLDYSGSYRYYTKNSYYSGVNQSMNLGFTFQKSRKLSFDWQANAGTTQNRNTGFTATEADLINPASSLIFDNRLYFLQGGMNVYYQTSLRTRYSVGGQGFTVRRENKAFASVNGYNLSGSVMHLLNQRTAVGAGYTHTHFDYNNLFGESDINSYTGIFSKVLTAAWRVNARAGIFTAEVQGLQRVALDPDIAALLGISTGVRTFYRKTTFPTGLFDVTRNGRTSTFSMKYERQYNPGNGIYLTSSSEGASLSYAYSGIRRWGFSAGASGSRMKSVGQDLASFSSVIGSVGVSRALGETLNLNVRMDTRYQQIQYGNLPKWSNRYTVGFSYSPAAIPLSLW